MVDIYTKTYIRELVVEGWRKVEVSGKRKRAEGVYIPVYVLLRFLPSSVH